MTLKIADLSFGVKPNAASSDFIGESEILEARIVLVEFFPRILALASDIDGYIFWLVQLSFF